MKKKIVGYMLAALIFASTLSVSQAATSNKDPGGAKGFFAGCCFGLRVGADYNQQGIGQRDYISWFLVGCCLGLRTQEDYVAGKDFHWRDICRILPYVGVIFQIWDGIDTMGGMERPGLQKNYGASYY
jgi:hypothetical protein